MKDQKSSLWLFVAALSGLLVFLSLSCGLAAIVLSGSASASEAMSFIVFASSSLVTLGLFGALLVVAIRGRLGKISPPLEPGRGWLLLAALWVILAVVALLLPASWQSSMAVVPFHVMLVVLPGLILFLFAVQAAGRGVNLTVRHSITSMVAGALALVPALPLELVGLLLSSAVVAFLAVAFPGGSVELERLITLFQRWSTTAPTSINPEEILSLLASPVVLGVLALTLAVVVPIVEEISKTLLLPLLGYFKRPQPLLALLWGAACGLGFALVEGVSNGGLGLGTPASWLLGVVARIPATAMHALSSGLIGLGWGYYWQGRRRWILPLAYLGAIIYHGLWNFNTVGILGGGALLTEMSSSTSMMAGGVLLILALGILGVLMLLAPTALIAIPLILRRRSGSSSAAEGEERIRREQLTS
ncbi:MAG: PrsW family glutamic-type intramembrane protease [Anaerolineae bacterium]